MRLTVLNDYHWRRRVKFGVAVSPMPIDVVWKIALHNFFLSLFILLTFFLSVFGVGFVKNKKIFIDLKDGA